MDRAAIIDRLADHLVGIRRHPLGVVGFMIEDEIAAGRAVMQPGSVWPFEFSADDWVFPAVVSHDGAEVRIVAILAKQPGNGAFRRLIANIEASGLRPVVVCPVGVVMPAILKRWGWRRKVVGRDIDRVDEWRSPIRARPADRPTEPREAKETPSTLPHPLEKTP